MVTARLLATPLELGLLSSVALGVVDEYAALGVATPPFPGYGVKYPIGCGVVDVPPPVPLVPPVDGAAGVELDAGSRGRRDEAS